MNLIMNDAEVRILACLIEKSMTTPDYYPLTLNALTNACNQKSNRNPVVSFEETVVVRGLDDLRKKGLTEKIMKADSRVPKYQHTVKSKLELSRPEIAVLCELMLRGPQTTGEIRSRADRMYKFRDIHEVEAILSGFVDRIPPLVIKLPRQPGQKEQRFMHLFSEKTDIKDADQVMLDEPATLRVRSENERIAHLESKVDTLEREIDELKKAFTRFRSQFE